MTSNPCTFWLVNSPNIQLLLVTGYSAEGCDVEKHNKQTFKLVWFRESFYTFSTQQALKVDSVSYLLGILKNMFLPLKTSPKRAQHCKDRSPVVSQLFAVSTTCRGADTDAFTLQTSVQKGSRSLQASPFLFDCSFFPSTSHSSTVVQQLSSPSPSQSLFIPPGSFVLLNFHHQT